MDGTVSGCVCDAVQTAAWAAKVGADIQEKADEKLAWVTLVCRGNGKAASRLLQTFQPSNLEDAAGNSETEAVQRTCPPRTKAWIKAGSRTI
jgi:hypothetical protein